MLFTSSIQASSFFCSPKNTFFFSHIYILCNREVGCQRLFMKRSFQELGLANVLFILNNGQDARVYQIFLHPMIDKLAFRLYILALGIGEVFDIGLRWIQILVVFDLKKTINPYREKRLWASLFCEGHRIKPKTHTHPPIFPPSKSYHSSSLSK